MKEKFKNLLQNTVFAIIMLALGFYVLPKIFRTDSVVPKSSPKVEAKSLSNEDDQVVAQTWGWGKLTSRPVWIKSSDPKSDFGDSAWIFQVGFQMNDNKIRTGYCVAPNSSPSTNLLWNVGDEVEVAYVSGAGDEPTPSLTYFVINHRPASKEVKKAPR